MGAKSGRDLLYPVLQQSVSPEDLERVYTPAPEECTLAEQITDDAPAYLGFLIYLKTFQRLGYFVPLHKVPSCIINHIAQHLGLTEEIPALEAYDKAGTRRRHREKIRAFRKVTAFQEGGAQVVEEAVANAAIQVEDLDDLINIAIEELIRRSYELPALTMLQRSVRQIRKKTYTHFYHTVASALTPGTTALLDALFVVDPDTKRSPWDRLKDPTGAATLANLKHLATRLAWFAHYQPVIALIDPIPEAKRRHFAAEAGAADITTMTDIKPARRYTLACALLAHQYARTLDDLTEMLIKRLRSIQHNAKEALQTYHQQHQERTDRLVLALRDVVVGYQRDGSVANRFEAIETVLKDRDTRLLQDCEAHLTYAGK